MKVLRRKAVILYLCSLIVITIGAIRFMRHKGPSLKSKYHTVEQTVYRQVDGVNLAMDVYRPLNQKAKVPAILFLHGGGWSLGDKSNCSIYGESFTRLGFVCFSADYRLVKGTRNQFPAQLEDVQHCMRWIRANAAKYNIDPNKVAVVGFSSGGHLAAFLGAVDTSPSDKIPLAEFSSKAQCVILYSAVLDLTQDLTTDPAIAGANLQVLAENLVGCKPSENLERFKSASPQFVINEKCSPFLIFQGSSDRTVHPDQSRHFYQKLISLNVKAIYLEFPGEDHIFSQENTSIRCYQTIVSFLKSEFQFPPN